MQIFVTSVDTRGQSKYDAKSLHSNKTEYTRECLDAPKKLVFVLGRRITPTIVAAGRKAQSVSFNIMSVRGGKCPSDISTLRVLTEM